ncbi:Uncharacterised protein [Citrobacter koseri]|nr:Uncharacterised protein [Citrobacter koseri]
MLPAAPPFDAHKYAIDRMVQAGIVPVTWQQVILEWQRDWARKETYNGIMDIVREHPAPTAWASIMPILWFIKRLSAYNTANVSAQTRLNNTSN